MNEKSLVCLLCFKNATQSIDLQLVSNVSLKSMFDIFLYPKELQLPNFICNECSEQIQSSNRFHQVILHYIESTNQKSIQEPEFDHRKLVPTGLLNHNFQCTSCQKHFKTNRGLQQHANYCLNPTQFHCAQCSRDFLTSTCYTNHMKCHAEFVCYFCDHGWISEDKLLEHVRDIHKDRLFHCKRCAKTERLRKTLNRHLRSAHGVSEREFYCGHCSNEVPFAGVIALTEHIQDNHSGLEEAGKAYDELLHDSLFPNLEQEEQEEHQEMFLKHFDLIRVATEFKSKPNPNKMILEEFLDEAFENDQIWTKYIAGGEEYLIDNYDFYLDGPTQSSASTYKCPRCDNGFNKQCHLTVHLAEQHNVRCLICNDCGANFNRINEYKNHRKEHLKDNIKFRENIIPEAEEALALVERDEKNYVVTEHESGFTFTCKLCERTFSKKCNLEKHQCSFYNNRAKDETTPISNSTSSKAPNDNLFCTLCDRKFTSISGLKYHLKRHTTFTPAFPCLYCSKKFTGNSNLNAHIRNVHSEIKNYVCLQCDARFAGKDHLAKHVRSKHQKDRPFVCPECPKSYFQKSHLNDHVASVHAGFAFTCEQCSGSYSSKGALRRHVIKTHSQIE